MGLVSLLLSFKGRIGRSQYWAGTLGVGGVSGAMLIMTSVSSAMNAAAYKAKPEAAFGASLGALGLILVVNALTTWCSLAIQVKRFHDRGRTGWFSAIPFVLVIWLVNAIIGAALTQAGPERMLAGIQAPVMLLLLVSVAFLIDLGCLPGQPFANKHGDPPTSGGGIAPRPQPSRDTESALLGAQSAIDRAIAEGPKATARQSMRVAPVAAQSALPPRPPAGGAPSFGRRAAR